MIPTDILAYVVLGGSFVAFGYYLAKLQETRQDIRNLEREAEMIAHVIAFGQIIEEHGLRDEAEERVNTLVNEENLDWMER